MNKRLIFAACVFTGWLIVSGGCLRQRPYNPALTRPVTDVDPKLATPEYWYAQPAAVTVTHNNFKELWDACERVARGWLFTIEVQDYRAGILQTQPMVSKQFWEIWRKDAGSFYDAREATLGNIRRTIRFQFNSEAGGGWSVTPEVLLERQSIVEKEARSDVEAPPSYWYALRRDARLELKIAERIRERLRETAPVAGGGR